MSTRLAPQGWTLTQFPYYSAFNGRQVLDPGGRFSHFEISPTESHLKYGYWKFAGIKDDRRAKIYGFTNTEQILREQEFSDERYDEIVIRWVRGSEDMSNRGSEWNKTTMIDGSAAQHLHTILRLRENLGIPLSFRNQVPTYPISDDSRLQQFWQVFQHHLGSSLQRPQSLRGPTEISRPRFDTVTTLKVVDEHEGSTLPAELPSMRPDVAAKAAHHRPAGHKTSVSPREDLVRFNSGPFHKPKRKVISMVESFIPSSPPNQKPEVPELNGTPLNQETSTKSTSSVNIDDHETVGHRKDGAKSIVSRIRSILPPPENYLSNAPQPVLEGTSVSRARPRTRDNVDTIFAQPSGANVDSLDSYIPKNSRSTATTTLTSPGCSARPTDPRFAKTPATSSRTQSPLQNVSKLPPRKVQATSQDCSSQGGMGHPFPCTDGLARGPMRNTSSPPREKQPTQTTVSKQTTRSCSAIAHNSSTEPTSRPLNNAHQGIPAKQKVSSTPTVKTEATPTSNALPSKRRPSVTIGHRSSCTSQAHAQLPQSKHLHQNAKPGSSTTPNHAKPNPTPPAQPIANAPRTFPLEISDIQLPCIDCAEPNAHKLDCHIGNIQFHKTLTALDYRSLADAVTRFDPGPWTTHFDQFPAPAETEADDAQIRGMADVVRNEEGCKEDARLRGLSDEALLLAWGFRNGEDVADVDEGGWYRGGYM
ncbi:hypothetical protein ACN47E_003426 [Coniothyrium glycines]